MGSPLGQRPERARLIGGGPSFEFDGCMLGITPEHVVVVGLDVRPRGTSVRIMDDEALRRPADPLDEQSEAPSN